jgi:hypothetical protein
MAMKTGLAKLEETEAAWETHAAEDTFYETTLAQYKARVQLSRDDDALILSLKQQSVAAKNRKRDNLKVNLALEKNIAKAIAGNKNYGEDSDFYEGTGRVRKSERKTGLTRRKKNGNEDE